MYTATQDSLSHEYKSTVFQLASYKKETIIIQKQDFSRFQKDHTLYKEIFKLDEVTIGHRIEQCQITQSLLQSTHSLADRRMKGERSFWLSSLTVLTLNNNRPSSLLFKSGNKNLPCLQVFEIFTFSKNPNRKRYNHRLQIKQNRCSCAPSHRRHGQSFTCK